jgi:hypothetical protein
MMPCPQFRLRSLFLLTALVAVGCLVGPPIVHEVRAILGPPEPTVPAFRTVFSRPMSRPLSDPTQFTFGRFCIRILT